jgi:hypothetical protein
VVYKLGETLQDMMVHDIDSWINLQYADPVNVTSKYEFDRINRDHLVRAISTTSI